MAVAKSRRIMGKDQFEQYIQDQLKDHKVAIDTNVVWNNIEGALPPKKRNGGKYLWLAVGLAILMVGAVFMMNRGEGGLDSHQNSMTPPTISSIDNTSSTIEDEEGLQEKSTDNENPDFNEGSDVSKATFALGNAEASAASDVAKGEIKNNTEVSNTASISNISKEAVQVNNQSTATISRTSTRISSSEDTRTTDAKMAVQSVIGVSSHRASEVLKQRLEAGTFGEGTTVTDDIEVAFDSGSAALERSERNSFTSFSMLKTGGLRSVEDETFLFDLPAPGLSDCYNFSGRSWGWSIDAYTGLNYAVKRLKENGDNTENSDYLDNRKSTEDRLEAFEAGLAINFMHRGGLVVSAGINYAQINEKFNFFSITSTTRFDSVVVRINIDSTGRQDSIKEWRPVTVQNSREVTTYNSYRTVDIPLGLGYQFYRGKWIFEVQGGVMINLMFEQKGEILNDQLAITPVDDGSIFKSKAGLSLYGGVKAIYPITNRVAVYAEPVGRFNLKPITVDGYSLTQRYNQFGLRLGARFTF